MTRVWARIAALAALAFVVGGCVVAAAPPGGVWVPGHWAPGPYGYHWVPGHYRYF